MNVTKTSFDKKLDERSRQGLELECQGIAPGVTGAAGSARRIMARPRTGRHYRDVVVPAGKNTLRIAIVDQPQVSGNRVTLEFSLELPLEGDGPKLAKKAGHALEAMVNDAVSERQKAPRRPVSRRSRRAGSA